MKKNIVAFSISLVIVYLLTGDLSSANEAEKSVIFHTYSKKKLSNYLKNNPVDRSRITTEKDQINLWVVRSEDLSRRKIKVVYPKIKKIYSKTKWGKSNGRYHIVLARYTSKARAYQVLKKIKSLTSNLNWKVSKTSLTVSVYKILQESAPADLEKEAFTFGAATTIDEEAPPEIIEKKWYLKTTLEAMKSFNTIRGYPDSHAFIGIQPGYDSQWHMFDYSLGANIRQFIESGDDNFYQTRLYPENSLLAWKSKNFTLSAGFATVNWGRMYENSPIDQLSVRDLSRFITDPLEDRRLSQGLIRLEHFIGRLKFDAVLIPYSQGPILPDQDSFWFPINTTTGQIIGADLTATEQLLVQSGQVEEDEDGEMSGGLRTTYTASGMDFGITYIGTKLQEPYFRVISDGGIKIKEERPFNHIYGADVGVEWKSALWRLEFAHYTDLPVTSRTYDITTSPGARIAASTEFYPGDSDQLINLQISSQHLWESVETLDPKTFMQAAGFWEATLTPHIRFRLRLIAEFDQFSIYSNPELAYTGWDDTQIYLSGHIFDGNRQSLFGYYRQSDFTMLGWKQHF